MWLPQSDLAVMGIEPLTANGIFPGRNKGNSANSYNGSFMEYKFPMPSEIFHLRWNLIPRFSSRVIWDYVHQFTHRHLRKLTCSAVIKNLLSENDNKRHYQESPLLIILCFISSCKLCITRHPSHTSPPQVWAVKCSLVGPFCPWSQVIDIKHVLCLVLHVGYQNNGPKTHLFSTFYTFPKETEWKWTQSFDGYGGYLEWLTCPIPFLPECSTPG